ncbi:MAG: MBOAT family protein [Pseudomonadota bacterium]
MLFNTYGFILGFLPVVVIGFYLIGRLAGNRAAISSLVIASLFFYGWWNPVYLLLIGTSIVVNYLLGLRLDPNVTHADPAQEYAPRRSRLTLWLGIAFNLGLLGYFKYMNFFADTAAALLGASFTLERIVLPLAISFFTFQQITYLVDTSRGLAKKYSFLHYALFVTFFPQLIAGPVVHHSEMMPQFMRNDLCRFRFRNAAIGLTIFILGLFKKVVVADGIAVYGTPVFDAASAGATLTFFEAWGGALAYTFQLYFDFSGYSDMAIGLARLFGIRLPLNFNSPYKATNIVEFWRRWHMTLSRFLRDYLYIPLGGNRKGPLRRQTNLMTTMLLGGLWHGAGWTFVAWGGLHGLYLVVNHFWHGAKRRVFGEHTFGFAGCWGGRLLTFLVVIIGWVFFRADSFEAATRILEGMTGLNGFLLPAGYRSLFGPLAEPLIAMGWRFEADGGYFYGSKQVMFTALLLWAIWALPNTQEIMSRYRPAFESIDFQPKSLLERLYNWRPTKGYASIIALVFTVCLLSLRRVSEFLYFQF